MNTAYTNQLVHAALEAASFTCARAGHAGVAVTSTDKVRATIRPAVPGGPAGGFP